MLVWRALYNLYDPGKHGMKPVHKLLLIALIGQDFPEARKLTVHAWSNDRGTAGVLDRCGRDHHEQEQAQRIDQDMPFTALDLFARVVAYVATNCGGLHALTVDNRQAGIGMSAIAVPQQVPQIGVHPLKGAIIGPFPEIVIDRAIIGQIFWQQLPLTTSFIDIEERIHHTAHTDGTW